MKRPLPVTFSARLTHAIFAVLTESPLDHRSATEKNAALFALISSRYSDLIDVFSKDNFSTLKFFLGEDAASFRQIWIRTFDAVYESGWYRRSFRARHGLLPHFSKNFELFSNFITLKATGATPMRFLSSEGQSYVNFNSAMPYWIAIEIDSGNENLFSKVSDCCLNDGGNVSSTLISSLTISGSRRSHELLGKLLLAAKLQEGLRQSIVESMDSGTPDAFIYLLKLIIDNNFERFSSVVRGFDVWTGLPVSSEKPATIRFYLEFIYRQLSGHGLQPATAYNEDNPLECYLYLLCKGYFDLTDAVAVVRTFLADRQEWKRAIAFFWLSQSQSAQLQSDLAFEFIEEKDPLVIAFLLENIYPGYGLEQKNRYDIVLSADRLETLFAKTSSFLDLVPPRRSLLSLPGMAAVKAEFSNDKVIGILLRIARASGSSKMMDFLCHLTDRMSADIRSYFARYLVTDISTKAQRRTIIGLAGDKSPNVRRYALEAIDKLQPDDGEYLEIENNLRFRSENLRKNILGVLMRRNGQDLVAAVARLWASDEENCRQAAISLVREMEQNARFRAVAGEGKKIIQDNGSDASDARPDNAAPGKGSIGQAVSTESPVTAAFTEENAFGLFNEKGLTVFPEPAIDDTYQLKDAVLDADQVIGKLNRINAFIEERRDFEYETESWNGSIEKVVFGSSSALSPISGNRPGVLSSYPFSGELATLISGLFDPLELSKLMFMIDVASDIEYKKDYDKLVSGVYGIKMSKKSYSRIKDVPRFYTHINFLLDAYISELVPDQQEEAFYYSIASQLYGTLSSEELCRPVSNPNYFGSHSDEITIYEDDADREHFCASDGVTYWFNRLKGNHRTGTRLYQRPDAGGLDGLARESMPDDRFRKILLLELKMTAKVRFAEDDFLPFEHLARAYESGFLTRDDLCFLMTRPGLAGLMRVASDPQNKPDTLRKLYPSVFAVLNDIIDHVIRIECLRGELPSALSRLAGKIRRSYGASNFAQIVHAMEKRNYVRGYLFANEHSTKGESLSFLLKNLYPLPADSSAVLQSAAGNSRITPQQWISAAMYAPQWLEIVGGLLQLPGLRKAGLYFHAHLNDVFDAEKEAAVSRFSSISPQDFKAGAFDLGWFNDAYAEMGEKNFRMVYDSAKYIAGGSLHKRSMLFADATTGKLALGGLAAHITATRNRDHLLAYTLVPIADQSDALARFLFIENFRKESKNFGAQRQQGESLACSIAIDNLARNAGYSDCNRFIWQMETARLEEMRHWFLPKELDDLSLYIEVDESGYSTLVADKNGKRLSSVPAKYKYMPLFSEGQAVVKGLREQFRRGRKTLESAMAGRDYFFPAELDMLASNPVISPLLRSLLFVSGERTGFWADGGLNDLDTVHPIEDASAVYIAHPVDFVHSGSWVKWQSYLFDHQIRQPFKQVFREYYCPSPDEINAKNISLRYSGHQIMPSKAGALARSKGWSSSEGLFKVYHKQGLLVVVFSGFSLFTPADVEPPVIEEVCFFDNKTSVPLDIAKVDPVLFSETMRDLDLIVSVAHFGEIDPESSHSTIEMRSALMKFILPLFKLSNVRIEGSHAFIKGQFGEYNVHLGSGVVHVQAKGAMTIVPVHSGQRGRIFLPFADEDPKTAEIISKIILLAEDFKIKDPVILAMIR
ncbi:MAG: DUF5724 domain-containing protein [Saccharofermentanales bacterium]